MHFGIWQIIYLGIVLMGVGIAIGKHGESQGNYNGWVTLISAAIQITLLALGGFSVSVRIKIYSIDTPNECIRRKIW